MSKISQIVGNIGGKKDRVMREGINRSIVTQDEVLLGYDRHRRPSDGPGSLPLSPSLQQMQRYNSNHHPHQINKTQHSLTADEP